MDLLKELQMEHMMQGKKEEIKPYEQVCDCRIVAMFDISPYWNQHFRIVGLDSISNVLKYAIAD